jgi:hypothetical protein
MNQMQITVAILLSMVSSIDCGLQEPGFSQEQNERQKHMVKQIQSGDREAILAAGNSGDLSFVPYLKKMIGKSPIKNDTPESDAQMALAKLDQPDELKAILCELQSNNPQISYLAVRKASYVGGWATMQVLEEMLTMDDAHSRQKWGPPPGDALYPSTNEIALRVLQLMFPEAAKDEPKSNAAEDPRPRLIMYWKKWISEHEGQLKQQPPLGKGLPQIKAPADGHVDILDLQRLCG